VLCREKPGWLLGFVELVCTVGLIVLAAFQFVPAPQFT
jgi:hypothetical protein